MRGSHGFFEHGAIRQQLTQYGKLQKNATLEYEKDSKVSPREVPRTKAVHQASTAAKRKAKLDAKLSLRPQGQSMQSRFRSCRIPA
jgi:hypothetical protein